MSADTQHFTGTDQYIATDSLKLAVKAARALQKPLLVKGEPGTGKTLLAEQVAESLGLDEDDNEIVNYIDDNTTKNNEVVFLTGVGQIFPLLRSHKILNILQQKLDKVPLIMFFPGSYSGRSLDIFNVVHDDNYYRAFKLD